MGERKPVTCDACGRAYVARIVGTDIVLATNDGTCACGNDGFVVMQEITETRAETTE